MPPRLPRPSFHALGDILREVKREDGSIDLDALQRARGALRRGPWWMPDEVCDPVDLDTDDDDDS